MPTYNFECLECGDESSTWVSIHESTLPRCKCGGELRKVYSPPMVAAEAQPNRKADLAMKKASEKQLEVDREAYRRLRREGVQPSGINGSTELEGASTQFEIEYGRLLPGKEKEIREGLERAEEVQFALKDSKS